MEKRVHIHVFIGYWIQDIDILCLTPYRGGAEAIKRRLCQENNNFYTVRAQNPNDHWNVLYWDTNSDEPGFERFKIDILIPGVMDLPDVHPDYIINIEGFPCAPLHLLLLHKLQGWDDRRRSRRRDQLAKVPADARDVVDLLRVAYRRGLNITKLKPYITDSFRTTSYRRVKEFSLRYPEHKWLWMSLRLPDPTAGLR